MRRHLIDHAAWKIDLAIAADRLLDELSGTKPEWSMLAEMKFFLGLIDEEAADAMGVKLRTLQRARSDARRWLFTRSLPPMVVPLNDYPELADLRRNPRLQELSGSNVP